MTRSRDGRKNGEELTCYFELRLFKWTLFVSCVNPCRISLSHCLVREPMQRCTQSLPCAWTHAEFHSVVALCVNPCRVARSHCLVREPMLSCTQSLPCAWTLAELHAVIALCVTLAELHAVIALCVNPCIFARSHCLVREPMQSCTQSLLCVWTHAELHAVIALCVNARRVARYYWKSRLSCQECGLRGVSWWLCVCFTWLDMTTPPWCREKVMVYYIYIYMCICACVCVCVCLCVSLISYTYTSHFEGSIL